MNCAESKELLVGHIEGLLAKSQKQTLESHLKACPPCRAELTQLTALRDRLAANGKALAQSDLENKVLNRIIQEQSSKLREVSKSNKQFQLWRIIMKSKMKKLTAAAAVIIIGIFLLFVNEQETLYAQAVKAFEEARSIHVIITEYRDGHWFKDHEIWYEREEGIREEDRFEEQTEVRIDNKQYEWRYHVGDKLVAQVSSYRDPDEWSKNLYEWLRFNPERDPSGDKVIDGVSCDMYALSIPSQGEGEKGSIWVDKKNRVLEFVQEEQRDGQEIRSVATIEYDIEIDKILFLPNFDSNVEIVGPRELIEEQFPLDTAIFKRESLGFVFAVHELAFGSGFKYIVCSNRLTEKTRDEISNGHPWTYYGGFTLFARYNKFGIYLDTSDQPILLARMKHDGIQIGWYILIPRGSKAKQAAGCDVDVLVNMANQLGEKLKAEGLPIHEKFRLNITAGETKEQSLSLREIASQVYSLGKKFDPIVHSFLLTQLVAKKDGGTSLAWHKPGIELSEEEYIKDIKNRVEDYLNRN